MQKTYNFDAAKKNIEINISKGKKLYSVINKYKISSTEKKIIKNLKYSNIIKNKSARAITHTDEGKNNENISRNYQYKTLRFFKINYFI